MLQEMQEIFYSEVPNIPLYYDSELHAYRTDHFGGWQNQPPDTGTPLFQFGPIGYTLLTDATAAPSPSASEATAPSPGASASPTDGGTGSPTSGSSSNTGLLLAVGAVVLVAVVGTLALRRRGAKATDEE